MTAGKLFQMRGFGAVTPRSLGKPAATFPAAIAGDAQLAIAVDRQQTRLTAPLDTVATSMTVADASHIVPWNLLSIDDEIVRVNGAIAGNTVPIGRGFDGTTPAIHLASALVSGFVDAYHHNALVSEIQAIESALGPNLSYIPAVPFLVSSNFIFSPQTPGGTLAAGNNVITLSPVPKGINGSDTNHYVYISGGAGTAEPALITGGSATSGSASGTLIINCANAHSGAWTIQSATAGIQEAITQLGANGGMIMVPAGNWTIYATITVPGGNASIIGSNTKGTTLTTVYTGGPLFSYPNAKDQNRLTDLCLVGPATGSMYAVSLVNQAYFTMERVQIASFPNGISNTGNTLCQLSRFCDLIITNITGNGVYINTTIDGGTFDTITLGAQASATSSIGFRVDATQGLRLRNVYTNQLGAGIALAPAAGQLVSIIEAWNAYFDGTFTSTATGIGISFQPAGGTINSLMFYGGGGFGFGWGVYAQGTGAVTDVLFDGMGFQGNAKAGASLDGLSGVTIKNVVFSNCFAEANNSSNSNFPGLYLANLSQVSVRGGVYAAGAYNNGVNTQYSGIQIGGGTTDLLISGPVVAPNTTAPIIVGGANTRLQIRDALGYNAVGQAPITVGASPFSYTTGYSVEVVYIYGGTVSNIKIGATTVATASPATLALSPNETITVTYSAAPTMVKDVR